MTVKELREFLSNCPDDMEIRYETEMSTLPIKKAFISDQDRRYRKETDNIELQNVEPFVYIY